ncbi:hypothetical protein JCM14469_38870 [Desulfatiferula olefinivorans]
MVVFFRNRHRAVTSGARPRFTLLGHTLAPLLVMGLFLITIFGIMLPRINHQFVESRKALIRDMMESTWPHLTGLEERRKAGELTLEQAQAKAFTYYRNIRYGTDGKDYFWIINFNSDVIMHPYQTENIGRNLATMSYVKGHYAVPDMVRIAKTQGQGFLTYHWQWKDDPGRVEKKISFVRLFEPWGWVVGTGVYVDDIERDMAHERKRIIFLSFGIFIVLCLVMAYMIHLWRTDDRIIRLTQRALAEQKEYYRTLFESSGDALLLLSRDLSVMDGNSAAVSMFGAGTRDELIGRDIFDLSPENQAEGVNSRSLGHDMLRRVLNEGLVKFEWMHRRIDGGEFPVESTMTLLADSSEGLQLAIIRDISERKKAEKVIRENEFRFRTFFNSNPQGVLLLDTAGTIRDVNRALLDMTGWSASDMVARKVTDFIPEPDRSAVDQAIRAMMRGEGQNPSAEMGFARKGGDVLPTAMTGWRITGEESETGMLGVFIRDTTREKHLAEEKALLQRQLIQTQRMEAIGTLAGGIAHDFNNILSGIMGFTELALIGGEASGSNSTRNAYLNRVLEAANRAKELVRQILTFSRREDGDLGPIAMTPLITECVKLLSSTLPSTITVRRDIRVKNDTVTADPTQIHQVIMNICTNAYHAMRLTGGELSLVLDNVTLSAPREFMTLRIPPGRYLKLSIGDTGTGMAPALVERIFDPYFTTKAVNEGTGLGLSVTLGIVRNYQGLIEVESTPGRGTRFDLYFPVSRKTMVERTPQIRDIPRGKGEHILVVDDEAFCLDVLGEHLNRLGYRITACKDGLTARDMIQRRPGEFDLLITDQTMPGMTGVQLAGEVLRIDRTLPVILCTGYSDSITEETMADQGIRTLIMKPVTARDLAWAVCRVLSGCNATDAADTEP